MTRLAWLTDTHFDFLSKEAVATFLQHLGRLEVDGVVLSGDIAHGITLPKVMAIMAHALPKPVYFVLGNHDFYGSSFAPLRQWLAEFTAHHPRFHYLTQNSRPLPLTATTAMIGHDGWGDGGYGEVENSWIQLNDWRYIHDFVGLSRSDRHDLLDRLGRQAADHVKNLLEQSLLGFDRILFITHVPPFPELCIHKGMQAGYDYLPHFACKAVGEVVVATMARHPEKRLTILAGHTHSNAEAYVLPNVRVVVAGADYGAPRVAAVVEVDEVFDQAMDWSVR